MKATAEEDDDPVKRLRVVLVVASRVNGRRDNAGCWRAHLDSVAAAAAAAAVVAAAAAVVPTGIVQSFFKTSNGNSDKCGSGGLSIPRLFCTVCGGMMVLVGVSTRGVSCHVPSLNSVFLSAVKETPAITASLLLSTAQSACFKPKELLCPASAETQSMLYWTQQQQQCRHLRYIRTLPVLSFAHHHHNLQINCFLMKKKSWRFRLAMDVQPQGCSSTNSWYIRKRS